MAGIGLIMTCLHSEAEEILLSVDYHPWDIHVTTVSSQDPSDSSPKTSLTIEGLQTTSDHGQPQLPVSIVTVKLPTYSSNLRVDFVDFSFEDYRYFDNPIVTSYAQTTGISEGEGVAGDALESAETPEYSDEPSIEIISEYYLNGYEHYAVVAIKPVGLMNANEAFLYNHIQWILGYDEGTVDETRFSPLVTNHAQNFYTEVSDVLDYSGVSLKPTSAGNGEEEVAQNYVILVPENLKDGVSRLRDWKRQKGYDVTVQTVEDILADPDFEIGSSAECFDKESSVREWMRRFYSNNGFFHCLIVGDYKTSAPIRKLHNPSASENSFNSPYTENYEPTDSYFSDLISKWEFNVDPSGLYSAPCEILKSYSPTISVGRLMCWTTDQINNYTDKLILYELNPGKGDKSYLGNALLTRSADMNPWRNVSIFSGWENTLQVDSLFENRGNTILSTTPQPEQFLDKLSNCGISSIQNHGSPISFLVAKTKIRSDNTIGHLYLFSNSAYQNLIEMYSETPALGLNNISNNSKPGVIYSLSCSICPYDSVFYPNGFNEMQQWKIGSMYTCGGKYGGVCLLGNTRDGYFTTSADLENEFGRLLNTNQSVGVLENASKLILKDNNSSQSRRIMARHHVFGDPEFIIWPGVPGEFSSIISNSTEGIVISGLNAQKGQYGICWGENTMRGSYEASNGQIQLPLSAIMNMDPDINIGCISLWECGNLPTNHLITTGFPVINQKEKFSFRRLTLRKESDAFSSPVLNLGNGSDIGLFSYEDIDAQNSIKLTSDAKLNLTSEKSVKLHGGVLEDSSHISISGEEIEITGPFTVAIGATLELNNGN